VELQRSEIERTNFASVRRGYDPAEVDKHLKAIADAAEEALREKTTASAASQGVKKILEAAEKLGADIEKKAREEGEKIAAEARKKGEEIVERARKQSATEERRAERAGERLKRANSELGRLRELLAGLQPVTADEPSEAETAVVEEGDKAAAATAHGEPTDAAPEQAAAEKVAQESPAEAAHEAAPEKAAAGGEAAGQQGDGEGARLIALNMAMTGTPREETARYLQENFDLEDPEAILDDAYSRAG
jgi:DivIVA domain-containing protein